MKGYIMSQNQEEKIKNFEEGLGIDLPQNIEEESASFNADSLADEIEALE